jgi:hypothetical protein
LGGSFLWRGAVLGLQPSSDRCYPWSAAVCGRLLSLDCGCLRMIVVLGLQLSLDCCWPWIAAVFGLLSFLESNFLWKDSIFGCNYLGWLSSPDVSFSRVSGLVTFVPCIFRRLETMVRINSVDPDQNDLSSDRCAGFELVFGSIRRACIM